MSPLPFVVAVSGCYHPTGSGCAHIEPHETYHFRITRDPCVMFFHIKSQTCATFSISNTRGVRSALRTARHGHRAPKGASVPFHSAFPVVAHVFPTPREKLGSCLCVRVFELGYGSKEEERRIMEFQPAATVA